jgi:hypothetical protein
MVSTGMILDPYSEIMDEFPKEMIVSHLFGLALYTILTLLSLNLAANRALVQGGNPDVALMPQEKAKRKAKIQPTLETASTESQAEALNIAHGSGNIFELENAENLSVEVYHYQRRLGRMYLRITGENEPIYIMLSNVSYMETPSFWKGANFQTASQADYEAFIQAKQIHISTLAEDTMRLYQSADVKIIAGKAEILDELPVNI